MNDHERVYDLLARRRELSQADEARVREHLVTCEQCAATAAAYERQHALMRSMGSVDPPSGLRARVLTAIAGKPRRPWWQSISPIRLAPPAAAALIAIVAVLAYVDRPQTQPATGPAALGHPTTTQPNTHFGGPSGTGASPGTKSHPRRGKPSGRRGLQLAPTAAAGTSPGASNGTAAGAGGNVAIGPQPGSAQPATVIPAPTTFASRVAGPIRVIVPPTNRKSAVPSPAQPLPATPLAPTPTLAITSPKASPTPVTVSTQPAVTPNPGTTVSGPVTADKTPGVTPSPTPSPTPPPPPPAP